MPINKLSIVFLIALSSNDTIKANFNELLLASNFNIPINNTEHIHKYLDGGFSKKTKIKLKNGQLKNINKIEVGEILEYGEIVYGIVEINGIDLNEQYQYNLGENTIIDGSPNLIICDKKNKIITTLDLDEDFCLDKKYKKIKNNKEDKLYHLLTNTKTFYINNIEFYDYNASIDFFSR